MLRFFLGLRRRRRYGYVRVQSFQVRSSPPPIDASVTGHRLTNTAQRVFPTLARNQGSNRKYGFGVLLQPIHGIILETHGSRDGFCFRSHRCHEACHGGEMPSIADAPPSRASPNSESPSTRRGLPVASYASPAISTPLPPPRTDCV